MKNKITYYAILTMLFSGSANLLSGQEITKEEAFYYYMNVSKLTPSSPTYESGSMEYERRGGNFLIYYANVFDEYNYKQNRNDEFEKNKYFQNLNSKILAGINNVKFENKYTVTAYATIGEYSFSYNAFPIYFNLKDSPLNIYDDKPFLGLYITKIINYEYFSFWLKMPDAQANIFIDNKKDGNGRIDRSIFLRFTYSIVNRQQPTQIQTFSGSNLIAYVYSIDILVDRWSTQIIGTLYPSIDFDDKVNGIRGGNGQEIIYYNSKGDVVISKSDAATYTVINYSNGQIECPVKSYYISQRLSREGCYKDVVEDGHGTGPFIWYYETGQKKVEVNYVNGKQDGKYVSYYTDGRKSIECYLTNGLLNGKYYSFHNTGQIKEEVNYINGVKDGCDYFWDANGQYNKSTFYKNGREELYSRACLSKSPPQISNPPKPSQNIDDTHEIKIQDNESNIYKVVIIGTQVWMAENLRSTQYRNNDPINNVRDNVEWSMLSTGAYCYYNNDIIKQSIYGNLYNHYAVSDNRGLCPSGWHVPTKDEWKKLIDYLGGETAANNKLRETGQTHWKWNNEAKNTNGFTGLPGGVRDKRGGFSGLGSYANFWSSTSCGPSQSYQYLLFDGNPNFPLYCYDKEDARSIRCVCDLDSQTFNQNK